MKRVLMIPDIHGEFVKAEAIIDMVNPDEIIFLGDYFDFFGDKGEDAFHIANWLKKSLHDERRVHLIGNHDISYMSMNMNIKCSGWNGWKHSVINSVNIPWSRLKLYHWVDDWLCTHAGLSRNLVPGITAESIRDVLKLAERDLLDLKNESKSRPFLEAGYGRGGPIGTVGGLIWCDYDEFVDIPKVKQIFGHTNRSTVRHAKNKDGSEHYCLDTGLQTYAICENKKISIFRVD